MTNPEHEELVKLESRIQYEIAACETLVRSPTMLFSVDDLRLILRRLASSDGGVKVRELEWRDHSFRESVLHIASAAFEDYRIIYDDDARWSWVLRPFIAGQSNYQTLDAAKAAAQADYEARIQSALVAAPPADAGMREALDMVAHSGKFQCFDDDAWDVVNKALTAPGATTKSDGGNQPSRVGLDWQLSDDAKARLAEIDAAIVRPGDPRLNQIIGGTSPVPFTGYGVYTPVTVRGSTSDPSSSRSEVTVEELAETLCKACGDYWWQSTSHSPENARWIKRARALLDQFEIRRK